MLNIPWWRIDLGQNEIDQAVSAIKNENLSQGVVTENFEREIAKILNVKYVTATTSGSISILMSLIAAGIKPGDEVIIPNRTWIATANAVILLGGKVVLVDVERDRPCIESSKIEKKITNKTKAIIPVHLNGRDASIEKILKIAKKNNLLVIEDAAQALYSRNNLGFLGCQSFCGCFSLSVAKIISTGQGGFIVSNNKEIHNKLQLMRTHSVQDLVNSTFDNFGFNFRFSDILASIGCAQIKRLEDHINHVKLIYDLYRQGLEGLDYIKLIEVNIENGEVPVYNEVLVPNRSRFSKYLTEKGIQTRPFYPNIGSANYINDDFESFSNSSKFEMIGLYLPSGPGQTIKNIQSVINTIKKFK